MVLRISSSVSPFKLRWKNQASDQTALCTCVCTGAGFMYVEYHIAVSINELAQFER